MTWMLLVLLYALLKGSREIAKKLAMSKNSVMEVLVVYTLLSFIFVIPQAPQAGGLQPKYYAFIAIKSFCIFIAWICSFRSLKKLPVSLYGILDLSRVLFATLLGVFVLGEVLKINQIFGLIIVCAGLLLLKFKPPFIKKISERISKKHSRQHTGLNITANDKATTSTPSQNTSPSEVSSEITHNSSLPHQPAQNPTPPSEPAPKSHTPNFYIFLAFISCILNAISGLFDKILMKDITSSQLQFWYMLFLIIFYLLFVIITREKISFTVFKNPWVWLLAVMFVIGDKALFIANGISESRITIMTLIKQSGCLVTILGGRFIFKEKNTGYRFFCATVIIGGIVLGVI